MASVSVDNSRNRVAFWKHHPLVDQSATDLVAATLAFHQQTRGDLVKLTPAGNYQIAGRGGVDAWCGDELGRRTIVQRAIDRPQQWRTLADELGPLELEMVDAARQLRQQLPADVPVLATVFAPLSQALMLAGPETLIAHLQTDPESVKAGLQILTRCSRRLIAAYQAAQVDGIYLALQHLSGDVLPAALYARIGDASDQAMIAACADLPINIWHIHGHAIHLACVPQTPNWQVHFELIEANPAPEAYRASSPCPAVIGLSPTLWRQATQPGQTAQLLARFQQDTALLTTNCVLPLAIPESEIAAWVERIHHEC